MSDYLYGTYGRIGDSIIKSGDVVETAVVYFGTAPINLVRGFADADLVDTPIVVNSLTDGQRKIGYCEDFESFTLCEALASHFAGDDPIGPAYFVNVLDPKTHKGDTGKTATLSLVSGKTELPGTKTILDSIRIPRPVPEGVHQETKFRANGTSAGDKGFDYAKAYKDAGITLEDGALTYEPTGKIDPKIVHEGYVYAGLEFTKPEGATHVKVKINGEVVDDLDLAQEGEFVSGGQVIEYIAVAKEDGTPVGDKHIVFDCEWTGGDTGETVVMVSTGDGQYFAEGDDYLLSYNPSRNTTVIEDADEVLPATITVIYDTVDDTKVSADDVIGKKTRNGEYSGIAAVDLVFTRLGVIPNILAAPGWSHIPEVGKALCKAARKASGHWDSIAYLDMPIVDAELNPVDTMDKAIKWKVDNHYDDERSKVFWPMAVDTSGRIRHLSALAAAAQMRVDMDHSGVPCETCANKALDVRSQYFGAETRNRGFDQTDANELTKVGITTVTPWGTTWVLWGDHTAAYDSENPDLDARCIFDVTMRMLMYITNSFQLEWADDIDKPMTRAMKDSIVNREQEKLDNLVGMGALLGEPKVEFSADVTNADILQGHFTWNFEATPTVPLKSATAVVVYTDSGFSVLLEGE